MSVFLFFSFFLFCFVLFFERENEQERHVNGGLNWFPCASDVGERNVGSFYLYVGLFTDFTLLSFSFSFSFCCCCCCQLPRPPRGFRSVAEDLLMRACCRSKSHRECKGKKKHVNTE
ncbi:hypothetical protein, unlikely [Trypanosoma brucei gambiense DAL972]|uniref:T. brucei spp.-specific protein n=1 Tax=Trypanosoma brucei gambiense (strain MHOM/CI/86/DAL972) TaxID=679716 RepID=D0A0F4_TRYB9|nr:hypothetical protein, unlikely [Trypanosoma brucei gambiense DAL972]CBH16712.1 hypothetical protein, unlikely [Trypanosoma brucei gambiense DAL972]|eukprot:XP_011778976.1 hypothetical protein, unlikely [Trypanosoma brucei gambiense DAL972]